MKENTLEININEAVKISGKTYRTIRKYYTLDHPQGRLPVYTRGNRVYTTVEDLHVFLSRLPKKDLRHIPEDYITPPGYDPLPIPIAPPPEFGLKMAEVARILCVTVPRIVELVETNKLELVRDEETGMPYVTHESLETHLKRVETWFYAKQIDQARKEVYGDIMLEAHKEAQRQLRNKATREKNRLARKALKRPPGRPVGVQEKHRRKRKSVPVFSPMPEDYGDTPA